MAIPLALLLLAVGVAPQQPHTFVLPKFPYQDEVEPGPMKLRKVYEYILTEESTPLSVCPQSHPYAYANGAKCCATECVYEGCDFNPNGVLTRWTKNLRWHGDHCQNDNYVACPAKEPCEDTHSICDCFPYCRHLQFAVGVNISGVDAEAIDGMYMHTHNINNKVAVHHLNRPVYINMEHPSGRHRCIWWNSQRRRWLVGACEGLENNDDDDFEVAFAYFDVDEDCPFFRTDDAEDRTGFWVRTATGLPIETSFSVYHGVANTIAAPPLNIAATGGLANGADSKSLLIRVLMRCKWLYRQGTWKCVTK